MTGGLVPRISSSGHCATSGSIQVIKYIHNEQQQQQQCTPSYAKALLIHHALMVKYSALGHCLGTIHTEGSAECSS